MEQTWNSIHFIVSCIPYDLKIKNTGNKVDTYNITLDAPKFVTISNTQVTLEAGEEQIVRLKAEPTKTSFSHPMTLGR